MTDRLEYTAEEIEKMEKIDEQDSPVAQYYSDYFDMVDIPCEDVSCEECDKYMTDRCLLPSKDSWAEGLNNIDDALEEKRHR